MGGQQPDRLSAARADLQSVTRACQVLELIGLAGQGGLTLAEITHGLAVSRSSAWVLLQTLMRAEFAAEAGPVYRRRYVLGPALPRLSEAFSRNASRSSPRPEHLEALTSATGFTSRFAMLQGRELAIVAVVDAPGAVRVNLHFDQPEQFHCTAVGKAVLAALPHVDMMELMSTHNFVRKTRNTITSLEDLKRDLETVRDRGYSIDDEEDYEGIICVGSSVHDAQGLCLGAVSVTALKPELPIWRIDAIGRSVEATASAISAELSSDYPEAANPDRSQMPHSTSGVG